MYLNPKLKEAYSKERLTAREAQEKAEWIAWGPVVFQVSRLMKKFGHRPLHAEQDRLVLHHRPRHQCEYRL